jgi:macrolide transport system ATP-binding/permease protein
MDMGGIRLLEEKLRNFKGAVVLISHDRALLDSLCTRIAEIEDGRLTVYEGSYSAYRRQKQERFERQQFEYEQYVREKAKLENAILEAKQRVKEMKKAPSRMGNSEARLHKRKANGKKAKVDRAAKAIQSRLDLLEVKEKPREAARTLIDMHASCMPVSRTAIRGKGISKHFGSRVLFSSLDFTVATGSKVALVGANGTGKTTLLRMIVNLEEGITASNGVRIGYFSQNLDILDPDMTILENVMKGSIYPESIVRTMLARLLFKREDVYKRVGDLSGGERVKAAFAKVFTGDANVIVLDEPTNYLDVFSQEALEGVLGEYDGTLLFASHDRMLIDNVADHLMVFESGSVHSFEGSYSQYLESKKRLADKSPDEIRKRQLLLETRLAAVTGKLSSPSANDKAEELDREFRQLVEELKEIRSQAGLRS